MADPRAWPELGDMPAEDFRTALHRVADWIADYREGIENLKISPDIETGEIAARLPAVPPDEAAPFQAIFQEFNEIILPGIVHWGHPRFFGYFGSTTTAPGILGEMLAAALNVSAMTWRTSPAATELETVVLDWLRQLLRLPRDFTGVVYDTASVAVLHALAAARENLGLEVRSRGLCGRPEVRLCAFMHRTRRTVRSKKRHYPGHWRTERASCFDRREYRLCLSALRSAIEEDLRDGLLPMAVVATVGTTSTTSVDPVEEIAALCHEYRLWLHVDAAYGGAMALLPEGRHLMKGVSKR